MRVCARALSVFPQGQFFWWCSKFHRVQKWFCPLCNLNEPSGEKLLLPSIPCPSSSKLWSPTDPTGSFKIPVNSLEMQIPLIYWIRNWGWRSAHVFQLALQGTLMPAQVWEPLIEVHFIQSMDFAAFPDNIPQVIASRTYCHLFAPRNPSRGHANPSLLSSDSGAAAANLMETGCPQSSLSPTSAGGCPHTHPAWPPVCLRLLSVPLPSAAVLLSPPSTSLCPAFSPGILADSFLWH